MKRQSAHFIFFLALSASAMAEADRDGLTPVEPNVPKAVKTFRRVRAHLHALHDHRPDDPRTALNLARFHHLNDDLARAERYYRQALSLDRNKLYYEARSGLAEVLHANEKYEEAREAWRQALPLAPGFPSVWEGLAKTLLALGKSDQAQEAYKKALGLDPKRIPALLELAALHHAAGRIDRAQEYCEQVLKLDPLQAKAHYNLGLLALTRDQPDLKAVQRHARAAIDGAPETPQPHFLMGLVLLRQGEKTAAHEQFTAASKRNPYWAAPHRKLAKLYHDAGPKEKNYRREVRWLAELGAATAAELQDLLTEARRHKNRELQALALAGLLEQPPQDQTVAFAFALAEIYWEKQQHAGAAALYERVIQRDPTHPGAVRRLAELDLLFKKKQRARSRIEPALKAHPDDVPLLLLAARLDADDGRTAAAAEKLQRARRIEPRNMRVVERLGDLLLARKEYDQAADAYRQALDIRSRERLRVQLALALFRAGRTAKALEELRGLLEGNPNNHNALFLQGRCYEKQTAWDQAIASWQHGSRIRPNDARFWVQLAHAYQQVGRRGQAIVYLRQLAASQPKNVAALTDLARLYEVEDRLQEAYRVRRRLQQLQPADETVRQRLIELLDKIEKQAQEKEKEKQNESEGAKP